MTNIKLLAVQAALKKLLSESHFSICTIRDIVKMLDLKPDRDAYSILQTLHCVHYNQMSPELLSALPDLIHKVLASPALDASRINVVSDGRHLSLVKN